MTSRAVKDLSIELGRLAADTIVSGRLGRGATFWINGGNPASEKDRNLSRALSEHLRSNGVAAQLVEEGLERLVTTMTSMDLVVTADTSISHLAAHKGIPSIVLWNRRAWNESSELDMVHNGPPGFACSRPFNLDVVFGRREDGTHEDMAGDNARLSAALDLMEELVSGNPLADDGKLAEEVERVVAATEAIEPDLYELAPDTSVLRAALAGLAAIAKHLQTGLSARAKRYLAGQPPPLAMDWVLARLEMPELLGLASELARLRFAYSCWWTSPLCKLCLTWRQLLRRRARSSRRFVMREDGRRDVEARALLRLGFASLDDLEAFVLANGSRVVQGYLPGPVPHELIARSGDRPLFSVAEVRLRRADGRCTLTAKSADEARSAEYQRAISDDEFACLWPRTEGRRVDKKRWVTAWSGLPLRIDVFAGCDLILAELESSDPDHLRGAASLGREITGEVRYRNRELAS